MKDTDIAMTVKPPRADVGQSSLTATQKSGTAGNNPATPEKATAARTGGSDTVTLTSSASEMAKLEENLARIPDVDNTRVEAIKASIADGSYKVDPEQVVDKLMKFEKDLT